MGISLCNGMRFNMIDREQLFCYTGIYVKTDLFLGGAGVGVGGGLFELRYKYVIIELYDNEWWTHCI